MRGNSSFRNALVLMILLRIDVQMLFSVSDINLKFLKNATVF